MTTTCQEEVWKPVLGFEGLYEASNMGRVKRLTKQIIRSNGIVQTFTERILGSAHDKYGYIQLSLAHKGTVVKCKAHRVIIEAFFGKIGENLEINHINGIKDDNRLINIEICTKSENTIHAYKVLGRSTKGIVLNNNKPVDAYFIIPRKSQKCKAIAADKYKAFNSIKEAAKFINISPSSITASIKEGRTAGGFVWKKTDIK